MNLMTSVLCEHCAAACCRYLASRLTSHHARDFDDIGGTSCTREFGIRGGRSCTCRSDRVEPRCGQPLFIYQTRPAIAASTSMATVIQ